MLFIKSLLCMRGFDNGRRFLLISLACYALFLLMSPVLLRALVLLVLLLLVTTPILLTAGMRRIHDAGFATPFAVIPVISFWVSVFGITFIDHGAAYGFLVLSFLVTLALTTISNAKVRRNRSYHFGYDGPVYHQESREPLAERRYYNRIEPTLAGGQDKQGNQEASSTNHESLDLSATNRFQSSGSAHAASASIEEQFGNWLSANKGPAVTISVVITLITLAAIFWFTSSGGEPGQSEEVETPKVAQFEKQRINKIELPDNFWVMLDQNDALTIAWQGDLMKDGDLWSALTGIGDRTCFQLRFNNGDTYRVMRVEVKNQGDYYADFSPIDTKDLIEGVAKKSRFSLCGFDFSLKGTQAELMTNKAYFDILTQE